MLARKRAALLYVSSIFVYGCASATLYSERQKEVEKRKTILRSLYTETKMDFRLLGSNSSEFYSLSQTRPALPLLRKEPILLGFSIFVIVLVA